jgi:rhodanese-related sulfurtransferase
MAALLIALRLGQDGRVRTTIRSGETPLTKTVTAQELKAWLSDGDEIAVFDVREAGIFGEGHLFFAVPLPYSLFEARLPVLAPNPAIRVVLCNDGDGIAERAARAADQMGYRNVQVLDGGAAAWKAAGYTLYQGVNLPSKTFGELVELERHTPRITADELQRMRDAGDNMVIVDGRTPVEYRRFNIPDGISCPNGELALRIGAIAPSPDTTIVVNCAGRTRSIIGAQTLIDFGVPNRVVALENGTQGWMLAGYEEEHGADRLYPQDVDGATLAERRAKANAFAEKCGAQDVSADTVGSWFGDPSRTTYLFDIRTDEEHAADGVAAAPHAPGGQLIQATDGWVGVRNARIVVADSDGVRAPMVAGWLRQLGHEAYSLSGGVAAASVLSRTLPNSALPTVPKRLSAAEVSKARAAGGARLIDLRPSMSYRDGHIDGAIWSIRPRLGDVCGDGEEGVVLITDASDVAALAASDLTERGVKVLGRLDDDVEAWRAAGLKVIATPDSPSDADCIDYLFFTHERRNVAAAARQYLAWEIGLVDQLDAQERDTFRIIGG